MVGRLALPEGGMGGLPPCCCHPFVYGSNPWQNYGFGDLIFPSGLCARWKIALDTKQPLVRVQVCRGV